jgi:pimeloyl-ACP methyl ester carboxylesterase
MSRTTLSLFFWMVLAAPAALTAQDAGIKKPFFDSAGVPIHYTVTGNEDGEPVVLIHGFTASIDRQWPAVEGALKKDHKVIAIDNRGHGGSGKPHDPKKYGIEMIEDITRLLDHLKIEKAHIVGYSLGTFIALNFAVRHPERVLSVTAGGAGVADEGRTKFFLILAESLEKDRSIGPLIIALTPKDRPQPTPEMIKAVDDAILKVNDPKALAAVLRGAATKEWAISDEQIKKIKAPVLALIGADDPLRPDVDKLKTLLPATRVVVIDKADHITAFMRPEFIAGLKQFLNEHRQAKK